MNGMPSVWNANAGSMVSWQPGVADPETGIGFTPEEEKEIVSLLPVRVIHDWCTGGPVLHLRVGLFYGRPCWSNIVYVFRESQQDIPVRVGAILAARGRDPKLPLTG